MTLTEFIQLMSGVFQAIGQIASAVVAAWAVYVVQAYARHKDSADFLRNRWNEGAQINILQLNNVAVMRQFEKLAYGSTYEMNEDNAIKLYLVFMHLNLVQHQWIAYQEDVMSKDEFENGARRTLGLIKRSEQYILFAVNHRGYSEKFAKAILEMLPTVQAVEPPPPELGLGEFRRSRPSAQAD